MLSPRARLVLLALATIAIACLGVAMLARSSHHSDDAAAVVEEVDGSGPKSPFKGALRPDSAPRDFALRNQDGKLIRTKDLRGRVVVVTPMYTTCRDTCPLVAQQIRDALRDMDGDQREQIDALAVSVDPSNDSRDSANRFLDTRRVRGYLDFLIGTEPELRPVWRSYGFSEQLNRREHNAYVVLVDKLGRQRVGFPVDFLTSEALAHDLRLLAAESG
jgi:protein SCO1/2